MKLDHWEDIEGVLNHEAKPLRQEDAGMSIMQMVKETIIFRKGQSQKVFPFIVISLSFPFSLFPLVS